MSKKYVIDLPDDAQYILINGASENHCYTRVEQVDDLEELNSDYINENFGGLQDEAYLRGHDDGYEAGCATAFKPVSDAEYQRGLNDAWEAAKKIMNMSDPPYWDVFGEYKNELFKKFSVSEAIAKLKAYDDEHSDRIEVGDEVEAPCGKAVVTAVKDDLVYYSYSDGDFGCVEPYKVTKTGKHYDIASILEEMRK